MDQYADLAVSRYRNAHATLLPVLLERPTFQNPTQDNWVRASALLQHLELDTPGVRKALAIAYPVLRKSRQFLGEALARVRFLAWMTLRKYRTIAAAYRSLMEEPAAILELGFTRRPHYETLREFINERLPGATRSRLRTELLRESKRLLPTLGDHQAQDGAPIEARRNDREARYSGYYHCRAYKADLVWDIPHEAYLGSRFIHSTDPEHLLVEPLEKAGIHARTRTVDGGYTSLRNIALAWHAGTRLQFKPQKHWRIDPEAAHNDVKKRYQSHRHHPEFRADAPLLAQARFLITHGTPHDIDACGRYLRDTTLAAQTAKEKAVIRSERSQNEGLNSELNNLPLTPHHRGELHARRRHDHCTLTLLLLQLVRLQHGVTTGLCRTSYIV